MRGWRATIAGAALLGVLLVDPAGAQATPTITATPGAADPGDAITVTVEGCDAPPRIGYQVVDGSGQTFEVDSTDAGGGAASAQVEAPVGDLYLYLPFGECGVGTTLTESPTARVDVQAPLLYASPSPELPETVFGTDCPAGATPVATVASSSGTYEITDLAVDERGDWSFYTLSALPVVPYGPGTIDATCGDVVYDTLAIDPPLRPGGDPPDGADDPAVTTPGPGSAAPAATPVPGRARFTG